MVNEQEEIKLGYLLDPCFELSNTAGKPLTNGWIEVYIHGTRNKYYCYSDFGGTLHPFKIPLDSLGSNIVLADPERAYDVYVYNMFGSLVMSRYNVSPGHAGGAAISSGGNAEHWIGRYGDTIQVAANEYSDSIPLPIEPDYEGTFIDHISDNKNIVLKDGLYLVDCLLSFRQNPDSLNNTLGYVHVFTGLDDGESGVFQRDETLPDTDPDETHNIRVQFVRHVEGSTGCNVCFQVRTTNAWSFVRIQGLSIVKLGAGGGIAHQPIEYDAGQYVSIDNDVISVTGLQPSGNYADASSVSQGFYDVNQQLSALSGQINEVSGQIPSLDGYATETYVQSAVSGKQDELEFTYDSYNKITTIDGHGIAGTGGGGGSGAVYTPGQYISIQNDIISVTGLQPSGEYLTQNDLNGYATDDDVQAAVSGKADKSEIPSLDGYATQQWVGEQNFATVDDVDEATSGKLDTSAYTAPVNADWNSQSGLSQILNKPEASQLIPGSGISIVPSGDNYIINSFGGGSTYTEGEYVKIENDVITVTGLQPSGEYLVPQDLNGYATETWVGQQGYATTDDVEAATSGKLDSSAYVAPLNADWSANSGLSQILNKPTEKNLVPGTNVTITESDDDVIINTTEIVSGLKMSAGPGVKLTLSGNNLVAALDETVLWETSSYYGSGTINLSEPYTNFERLKVLAVRGNIDQSTPYAYSGPYWEYDTDGIITGTYNAYGSLTPAIFENEYWKYSVYSAQNTTTFVWCGGGQKNILTTGEGTAANSYTGCVGIKKVIGINRKAGN